MKEQLVDVLNDRDTVLHVVTVTVEEDGPKEAVCEQEALKAAGHLHLVPDDELGRLKARLHVDRRGSLTPIGDVLQVRHETQERAEYQTRTRAYFLWKEAGCPDGQSEEHWHKACVAAGS